MCAMNRLAGMALCAAAALVPAAAGAQSSDAWQFGASLYAWLPSVKGSTAFAPPPGSNGGNSVTVDAADILNHLDFVFMGNF